MEVYLVIIQKSANAQKEDGMSRYKVTIEGETYIQHRRPTPSEQASWEEHCEKTLKVSHKEIYNPYSCYRDSDDVAYIPFEHIRGSLIQAGSGQKMKGKGSKTLKSVAKGVAIRVCPDKIYFDNRKSHDFVDERWGKINDSQVMLRRPAFSPGWKATFELVVDDSELKESDVRQLIERAGNQGIGDYRPSSPRGGTFGCFKASSFEVVE
jgi:hypothetical protein